MLISGLNVNAGHSVSGSYIHTSTYVCVPCIIAVLSCVGSLSGRIHQNGCQSSRVQQDCRPQEGDSIY